MQTVRKHIKLSHILFFPFGLWRWADWTGDNNPGDLTARPPACLPLRFTIMRGKLWVTARTSRDDRNHLDDELNYYDLSHSQNICPLSLHVFTCWAKQVLPTIWRLYDNHSNQLSSPLPARAVTFNSPDQQKLTAPRRAQPSARSCKFQRETERSRRHKHQSGV